MRRTIPAVALLALTLTGCDDGPDEAETTPAVTPTTNFTPPPPVTTTPLPTTDDRPTGPATGSAAPAPDQPGPEPVPTPAAQLDGP